MTKSTPAETARIIRRQTPVLPERPRVHPITSPIFRSYSVGRQNFMRLCQGEDLVLTITTETPFSGNIQVSLLSTLSSPSSGSPDETWSDETWLETPFTRIDDRTLRCCVLAKWTGLHSFRAQFSTDLGATWVRDSVPDAWVLVDPAQVDALRLYTLIPTVSGTIADWKDDLRRVQQMGFNAVHLLPVTSQDASESPYAAQDLFEIEDSYRDQKSNQDSLTQFEEFVEEAATLRLRLCFDLVLNHIGLQSRMTRRAPDWIMPDQNQPDGFLRARYWSSQGWQTWDDLVLINYEHPSEEIRSEIWAYMIDYALFWANYAHQTGGFVRFDNLHSSDPAFIQSLTTALHRAYPEVGILGEYFTDERTLLDTGLRWGLNLVMATPWSYKFAPQLREYLKYIHRVSGRIRYFMPITSHDSGAPAQEFGTSASTVPRYVAAALLGTGATGMPQGVEFGEPERIDFIGRKPRMASAVNPMLASLIRQVNTILAEHPAFRRGGNCCFVDDDHPAVIAAFRQAAPIDSDAPIDSFGYLVICNFDTLNARSITIDLTLIFGSDGPFTAHELLEGKVQTFPSPRLSLSLPPCTAQALMLLKRT